jgi:parallel beta-helix repeat protein
VTSVDPEVAPAELQQFLGDQLRHTDHDDFGFDTRNSSRRDRHPTDRHRMWSETMISAAQIRALFLVAVFLLLGSACAAPPEPLVRHGAPPRPVIDPTQPCIRETPPRLASDRTAGADVRASFDSASNTIVVSAGEGITLPTLSRAIGTPAALREVAPGEWLLAANLHVHAGASLRIAAPDVRWLKVSSSPTGFVSITALGGGLDVDGSCITSWDEARGQVDSDHADGRSFVLARSGARMTIQQAELRYLGYGDVESYGLSWRTASTSGGITSSLVSHLFYGLYTYEVSGLVVQDNEFHDNVLYGIDPHTDSRRLVIERNVVHHNGKHGIILAEDCTDSVIRDNIVHSNEHHGIVLYLRSDRNLIERNHSFANAAQGVNINASVENVLRGNRIYDNRESGIGVGQTAEATLVENNQIRSNQQDGIRLVSEATHTTVRGNVIGENGRHGVYIDGNGVFDLTGNTIFGNRTGVMSRSAPAEYVADNRVFDNIEAEVGEG